MPWAFAAMAAAAAISAVGAIQSGKAQDKQARYAAEVNRQQATRERQDAANAEDDYRRDASRMMAARRAAMGATGVEPGEGSPLLVSEDLAAEAELQALRIRSGGELRGTRLEQQANLNMAAGRAARQGSYYRAGSLLLHGAGQAYGMSKGGGGGEPGSISSVRRNRGFEGY